MTCNTFPFSNLWFCDRCHGSTWECCEHALIPTIYTWLDIAAPFHPGSANVQPNKPRCAGQTSSSCACSVILDFFILLLCNTPQDIRKQHQAPSIKSPLGHIILQQILTKNKYEKTYFNITTQNEPLLINTTHHCK